MVTDEQVRKLMAELKQGKSLIVAAARSGMDVKTARKYRRCGRLPSELETPRTWRTREDPFQDVWSEVKEQLETNPGLEAKTLFQDLQRRDPGTFQDGQLRTLQRRIKAWRALEGPSKEVFFAQVHEPGRLCQSDFTHMDSLAITIEGQPFPHLLYHFVLTYSNWETGRLCFSENYESLSEGLQSALWELGGVPEAHQTDQLSAAVHQLKSATGEEFTDRYESLLRHYGIQGRKIQAGKANENGDIEQRHHRFKRAVEQTLLLRGSRDFCSRAAYEDFLRKLFSQFNVGRRDRFETERKRLRPLPSKRLEDSKRVRVRVNSGSTIRLLQNTYTVHSRLIGEWVEARLTATTVEIWYAQRCVESLERLRGKGKSRVDYRHIIDWLVRKPGAFENYVYRSALFPTSRFRMAFDFLQETIPGKAVKEYLSILAHAAKHNESRVDDSLRLLLSEGEAFTSDTVVALVQSDCEFPSATDLAVDPVDLHAYDGFVNEFASQPFPASCGEEAAA